MIENVNRFQSWGTTFPGQKFPRDRYDSTATTFCNLSIATVEGTSFFASLNVVSDLVSLQKPFDKIDQARLGS